MYSKESHSLMKANMNSKMGNSVTSNNFFLTNALPDAATFSEKVQKQLERNKSIPHKKAQRQRILFSGGGEP